MPFNNKYGLQADQFMHRKISPENLESMAHNPNLVSWLKGNEGPRTRILCVPVCQRPAPAARSCQHRLTV